MVVVAGDMVRVEPVPTAVPEPQPPAYQYNVILLPGIEVALRITVEPEQTVTGPLIDVGVCGISDTTIVMEIHAEGGQAPPSQRAKYRAVMTGATVRSPPCWIKLPPQGLDPVYHLRKVPLPPFTCNVTGVPTHVGFLFPSPTNVMEVGSLFVTVTVTVADAHAPVLQVFSQRA